MTRYTIRLGAGADTPAGVLFHSDWSTALGSTDTAIFDTNKTLPWDAFSGGTQSLLEVVAAPGSNAPTTNALRVTRPGGSAPLAMVYLIGHWDNELVTGGRLFYRSYQYVAYNDVTATGIGNHHPEQTGHQGQFCSWNWHFSNNTDGTYLLYLYWDGVPNNGAWRINTTSGATLPKNQWLRKEWMVEYNGSNYQMLARLYDDTNTLLYQEGTTGYTKMIIGDGSNTLVTYGFTLGLDAAHTTFDRYAVGSNGGDAHATDQYHYYAACCIRNDTWCGPYSGGI